MSRLLVQGIFGAVIAAGFLVSYGDGYFTDIFISCCLFGMLAMAWNLAAGVAGLLSLGHSLFFGLSAYTVTIGLAKFGMSSWVSWPLAIVFSVLCAAAIGALFFRYRVKGYFFSIGTLAFAEVAFLLMSSIQWVGRSDGLMLPTKSDVFLYWQFEEKWPFALAIALLTWCTLGMIGWLVATKAGFYWRAIRDNEDAAEALGVPTSRMKIYVFSLSAGLAGVCGAFYANYFAFVNPRSTFGIDLSIQLLVFSIVGGMRSYWGPLLGALLLMPLSEVLRHYAGSSALGLNLIAYAVLVLLLALYLPDGLAGALNRRLGWRA
jgi:branched-chain amino acid transport system permease protein